MRSVAAITFEEFNMLQLAQLAVLAAFVVLFAALSLAASPMIFIAHHRMPVMMAGIAAMVCLTLLTAILLAASSVLDRVRKARNSA